ncbi:hypothetical protein DE146DRAFT_751208 [Phaeosphaeria sp. MPI-PUGE-AT-0046c]|nr:hypothetical protein DE146DRAFT_751208 [Phaeosphaeria sp. MPI-PUGE-AT-0046c]
MDDDDLFPAYRDYVQGIINSVVMPDTELASLSVTLEDMVFGPVTVHGPPSPGVLDLRSPSPYPTLMKIIPPEALRPAPPPPHVEARTPTGPTRSAQRTRQRLFRTSQRQAPSAALPPTSSQQLLHSLRQVAESRNTLRRRGRPLCQSTNPSLLRSSSATDVDSEVGQSASSTLPILPSDSPSQAYDRRGRGTFRLQQAASGPQEVSTARIARLNDDESARGSPTTLIRPGETLNHGRFDVLPEHIRQQMNAQLTEMWNIVNAHPEPSMRNGALAQISAASARFLKVLETQENALRMQAHQTYRPPLAPDGPQLTVELRTRINKALGHYLAAVRKLQTSLHDSSGSEEVLKAYPMFRESLPLEGRQYLDIMLANARSQENLPIGSLKQLHTISQYQQPRQGPYLEQPRVPQPLQVLQSQSHYSTILQAQREVPLAAVSNSVRHFVDANVPKYFEAMRYMTQPLETSDAEIRQKAQIFLKQFDEALPPEGRSYLNEIVQRVAIDENAGLYDQGVMDREMG